MFWKKSPRSFKCTGTPLSSRTTANERRRYFETTPVIGCARKPRNSLWLAIEGLKPIMLARRRYQPKIVVYSWCQNLWLRSASHAVLLCMEVARRKYWPCSKGAKPCSEIDIGDFAVNLNFCWVDLIECLNLFTICKMMWYLMGFYLLKYI